MKESFGVGQVTVIEDIDLAKDYKVQNVKTDGTRMPEGWPVLVKNCGIEAVTLEVKMYGMEKFVATTFYPGWNPERITEIKANADVSDIQIGY